METEAEYTQAQIKQGWKNFITGMSPVGLVRPEIIGAWERSRTLGVDPTKIVPSRLEDPAEIRARLNKNQELMSVSVPALHFLYQFLHDANLLMSLSDSEGYLLGVYGDTSIVSSNCDILYTNWSESGMGTNPIGTSLAENRPVQIRGYEHYCMFPHRFSGAAVPIHAPTGEAIGAVSINYSNSSPHPHTLAMIVMTAYAIEQQLELKESAHNTEIAYQHVNVVINSISEGLVVLNHLGRITMVNDALLKLLHLSSDELLGLPISAFLHDHMLDRAFFEGSPFTDYVTQFQTGKTVLPCTITHRTVGQNSHRESVLIINELSRIHKLAAKLTGARSTHTFETVVACNPNTQRMVQEARAIAGNDSNVLLLGESGTGKDVFAQSIHNASPRRDGPFIPINCGAIQKELILSELFGYVDGAFTGAKKGGSMGTLEYANGGTVFLDEIGEMPLELQPTLLRAIEQRIITRVGGKEFIPINVRIIAATNRDLYGEVLAGRFRQDLFYRLNIFTLKLLPLRERREDIPELVNTFLNKLSIKYGKVVNGITDEALAALMRYDWPGNIRELQNCVERCVALAQSFVITEDLLPAEVRSGFHRAPPPAADPVRPEPAAPAGLPRREEDELRLALEQCHWNITRASQLLGVTRATVYRRMRKYGLLD